jgi:hypothetical protein
LFWRIIFTGIFIMAYENPTTISYSLGSVDFGAGNTTHYIKGPTGKVGRIVDVMLDVTETFNAVTTSAFLRAGSGSDADAYWEYTMGTTAQGAAFNIQNQAAADKETNIPANGQVVIACVAPTGGTPAGIAKVTVAINWW